MARKKLPGRPDAPSEPRSWFLPVAAVIVLISVGVLYPVISAAEHEDEGEAETQESAEPELATLTIRTVPEGAEVAAGDEECTSPCDLELPVDEAVTLRVVKEGFKVSEQELTPSAGMEPLDLELEAAPFVLSVKAPEGATVTVRGEEVADPSAIELGESLGEPVAIEVRQRGFQTFEVALAADAFEAEDERRFHELEVELERRSGGSARRRPAAATAEPEPEDDGPVPSNPF